MGALLFIAGAVLTTWWLVPPLVDATVSDPKTRLAGKALAVGAVLLPLARLFDLRAGFGYDWYNHQWMIAYFGEYLRTHYAIPAVFNSNVAVGMPQPVFYGFIAYPLIGVVSSFAGAAVAVRVAAVLAITVQFTAVLKAGHATLRHRGLSGLLAFASVSSVYALTNLYNRAAITEYFAASTLVTALAFGLTALVQVDRRYAWWAGVMFTLTLGCHPPTALLGTLFVALLTPVALPRILGSRSLLVTFAAVGALALVAVAPWLYANTVFRSEIGIVGRYRDLDLMQSRTDSPAGRFLPFPAGDLVARNPDDLAYLEAPLDAAVLLVLAWSVVQLVRKRRPSHAATSRRRWLWTAGTVAIIWGVLMTTVSLSRTAADIARPLAPYVQFCYRFVTHANAGLLLATLALGGIAAARGAFRRGDRPTRVVVAVGVVLALMDVTLKLRHAGAMAERRADPAYVWGGDRTALITDPRADAAADYAAVRHIPQLAPRVAREAVTARFVPGDHGDAFGVVPDVTLELPQAAWVVTNVVLFPWNELAVDGRPAERVWADRWRSAVHLPAGQHTLRWNWRPAPRWQTLTHLSRAAFLAMIVVALLWPVRAGLRRRHSRTAS